MKRIHFKFKVTGERSSTYYTRSFPTVIVITITGEYHATIKAVFEEDCDVDDEGREVDGSYWNLSLVSTDHPTWAIDFNEVYFYGNWKSMLDDVRDKLVSNSELTITPTDEEIVRNLLMSELPEGSEKPRQDQNQHRTHRP